MCFLEYNKRFGDPLRVKLNSINYSERNTADVCVCGSVNGRVHVRECGRREGGGVGWRTRERCGKDEMLKTDGRDGMGE